jgi:hypothetical protein
MTATEGGGSASFVLRLATRFGAASFGWVSEFAAQGLSSGAYTFAADAAAEPGATGFFLGDIDKSDLVAKKKFQTKHRRAAGMLVVVNCGLRRGAGVGAGTSARTAFRFVTSMQDKFWLAGLVNVHVVVDVIDQWAPKMR